MYIRTLDDVKTALKQRLDYFASCGCRLSDQSFGSPDFTVWDEEAAQEAMNKALNGEKPLDYEVAAYQSLLMDFLGGEYAARGTVLGLVPDSQEQALFFTLSLGAAAALLG